MGSEQISRFTVQDISFFEREVKLRMPFRFGVVTLTESPQAFVKATIRLPDGKEAQGAAAELLAPKWFDKNTALSNEDNYEQLRAALRLARGAYLAGGENSAFGHWSSHYAGQIAQGARQGLNSLVACYGPALIDRALLDALCRALGISFFEAIRKNVPAISFAGLDMNKFLSGLKPQTQIAARHTVGLVDSITSLDNKTPVKDGLPETLEEVIARYGHRWFKLKVSGDLKADLERLSAIAAVLDRIPGSYHASLDGNEQYEDVGEVLNLWRSVRREPRLKRLSESVVFIEQPIKRQNALKADVSALAAQKPVIIDESDDSLDAFPRAKALGYRGVSSKTCKGIYKSLINAARCAAWGEGCFMSGEDLTIQAGLALQQDLALVSLLGLKHVERNGHHYVNGMAGLPDREQRAFLDSHPDLYEKSHGAVRVRIDKGLLQIGSLDCPGFASRAMPDWQQMREMR
jgi:L-alanine-DL-glutamate epimerase-like enolase superfamily enzyme